MAKSKGLSYREAGVDIDAGNRLVELIKPLTRMTARGCSRWRTGWWTRGGREISIRR